MEDREILACMRSLIAEEHWLKARRPDLAAVGGAPAAELDRRLEEVASNLRNMCELLRGNHREAMASVATPGALRA
jgi:hypothetical protein